MQDLIGYITIHNDMWDDCGKVYKVLSYFKRGESTGIRLELEHEDGKLETRVVPEEYIEWISDGDTNVSF
jgi:hypothetical protein